MSWIDDDNSDFFYAENEAAMKIQGGVRKFNAQLQLKNRAAWEITEKLEYSDEQNQAKLRELFDALFDALPSLSPTTAEALQRLQSPADEEEISRSTLSYAFNIESDYEGLRIDGPITEQVFLDLIESFRHGQILNAQYVFQILHEARAVLKTLQNYNLVELENLGHVTIVGDLHGQLADLLYIFQTNGLPSASNAFVFNGDFVDRGENSMEVILLLLVALILYPQSVFLNRGRKLKTCCDELLKLFPHVFKWLPLYSIVNTGIQKLIVMHGGISDRIHLSQLESLPRSQYLSVVVRPKSRTGGDTLTEREVDEYHQIQDLLWSDPNPDRTARSCIFNKARNSGYLFAADVTQRFLQKYGLSMIIRSHEVKPEGYEYRHGGQVLTIFSASNYNGHTNRGAVIRWFVNESQPKIIQHRVQSDAMEKLSFRQRVNRKESSNNHQLIEKIVANKTSLLRAFQRADRYQNGHVSLSDWVSIMSNVLQMNIPWVTIRSKLVQEDSEGILYETMFQRYTLNNSRIQMSNSELMENLYQWKDILLSIFNLIDRNHSGSINRQEFADIIRILMEHEKIDRSEIHSYVDELTDKIDTDGNGRIDFEEFFEGFKLVSVE